jgi:hypothetical protein
MTDRCAENPQQSQERLITRLRPKMFLLIGISLVILLLVIVASVNYCLVMPGSSYKGKLPPLSLGEVSLKQNLHQHVHQLSVAIGERNFKHPEQLEKTAQYIKAQFENDGWHVDTQTFEFGGLSFKNLIVERLGSTKPDEIVVVGAHYDSVVDCPAANDNGTGVAALLCLAQRYKTLDSARTTRFVAFTNEEQFFGTEAMGSYQYAQSCFQKREKIVAMLSLETLGYCSDLAGSQQYPPPLNYFYPNRGNFVAFVGALGAAPLVRECVQRFRTSEKFPCEGAAAPTWIQGIDWSDHKAFSALGYPALMITDTAVFRYPFYHTSQDKIEHIDFDRLTLVTNGIGHVISHLVSAEKDPVPEQHVTHR